MPVCYAASWSTYLWCELIFSWSSWHYSDKFWAASCNRIQTLSPTVDKSEEGFMKYIAAELWMGTGIENMNFTEHVGFDFHGRQGYGTNFPYRKILLPEHYSNISDLWRQYLDS
jgi:hypothetical protein